MEKYITTTVCLAMILVAFTYCSKLEAEQAERLNRYHADKGETLMDRACSNVPNQNAGQSAVCVAYFNTKK